MLTIGVREARPANLQPVRSERGVTLIETMIVVAMAGVLSSIAYPSFESALLRARRTDALVAVMQTQLAQERHRARHASYGGLADIGLGSTSPSGYYALAVTGASPTGYQLTASAQARQSRDASCRHLRVTVEDASTAYVSGADASFGNGADANRRCWGH